MAGMNAKCPLPDLLRAVALALTLLVGSLASAAVVPQPDGALARWLETTVAPELATTLARHPRFADQRVGFVALERGRIRSDSTALHEGIERLLRQRLLSVPGVRLVLDGAGRTCDVHRRPGILLGIDIAGDRAGRVSLAAIDPADGEWIGGLSHEWRGRLAQEERRALATTLSGAAPGSAGNPLPGDDPDRIASALATQLGCSRPDGIPGAVQVTGPGDAAGDVALALRGALGPSPLVVLAAADDSADGVLRLEAGRGDAGERDLRELVLVLEQGDARQRLASVFTHAHGRSRTAPLPEADLLGVVELEQVRPTGVCARNGRDAGCAEVRVELREPAWLFVLATRDGVVQPLSCSGPGRRRSAGERRFRFDVGDLRDEAGAPDAGVYVLAVADADLARSLADMLAGAPGACGSPRRPVAPWLDDLARVLERHGARIDWRAVHVVRRENRVVQI